MRNARQVGILCCVVECWLFVFCGCLCFDMFRACVDAVEVRWVIDRRGAILTRLGESRYGSYALQMRTY